MKSLRARLFALLLLATGSLWLGAMGWIWFAGRSELEHVLDARLQEAARMVHSLVARGAALSAAPMAPPVGDSAYSRQLSCQIWSLDGRLVGASGGAPQESFARDSEGFSEPLANGERWRVYTIVDPQSGVRVAVGDRVGLRERLARDRALGLLAPAAPVALALGLLLWLAIARGLRPLNALARDIAGRDGEDFRPLRSEGAPTELSPLIGALNGLFARVEAARRQERDIAAFAAHELRTPLAGVKTQAQVALAAPEGPLREKALRQIAAGADRAADLAARLLTLARLEAEGEGACVEAPSETQNVAAGPLLRDIAAAAPGAGRATIDPALDEMRLRADEAGLRLVLRNLHENALRHGAGAVHWRAARREEGFGLALEDEGPGVPEADLEMLTRRFWRGRTRSAGAGLGLAIARLAAERIGARLVLANRPGRSGLLCLVIWPAPAGE